MRDVFKGHPFGGPAAESLTVLGELAALVVGVWLVLRLCRLLERASSGSVAATAIAAAAVHVGVFATAEVFAQRNVAALTSSAAPLELLVATHLCCLVLFVSAVGLVNQSLPPALRAPLLVAPLLWGFRLVERVTQALHVPDVVLDRVKSGPLLAPLLISALGVQVLIVVPLSLGVVFASGLVPAGVFVSAVIGVAKVLAGGGDPNGHGAAAFVVVVLVIAAAWALGRVGAGGRAVAGAFARRRIAVAALCGGLSLYLAAFVPTLLAAIKIPSVAEALARVWLEPRVGVVQLILAVGTYAFLWAGLSSTIDLAVRGPLFTGQASASTPSADATD
jgi:hypothetical protein